MIPEYELRQMYNDEQMTQKEIADEIGVNQVTISSWMRSYKIESRTKSEYMAINSIKLSREKMQQMYRYKKMTQTEIAEVCGVSVSTISKHMKKYGIESRSHSEANLVNSIKISKEELQQMYYDENMTQEEIGEVFGISKLEISRQMKKYGIKPRLGSLLKPPEEKLQRMYLIDRMSAREIADEIGVFPSTIINWMKECGINARTQSEAMTGKFTGKNACNWHGGISSEPYCNKFNDLFKESVRGRDNYICQLCGNKQEFENRKLSVHHIHYDKENCYPDVVSLCHSCHSKVNGDRDYWEQYFENQLLERGLCCWSLSQET